MDAPSAHLFTRFLPQAANGDPAGVKRPAAATDSDSRKRKAPGRPRKQTAGSPEPAAADAWNGASGPDAAPPAGTATVRG